MAETTNLADVSESPSEVVNPDGPEGADGLGIPTRILVFGMAHADGSVFGDELYPVAEACGLGPEQVRSCLRRLVAEGLLIRHGEGRDARYDATDDALAAYAASLRRHRLAFTQDAAGRGWDGRWRVVAFAIPEARRSARDALRDRLIHLGGAAVQNGLYVSPHRWDAEVRQAAEELDVVDHVTLAVAEELEVGGDTDPRALAARLWDLDDVMRRYRRFIDTYGGAPAELDRMRRNHERLEEKDFLPGVLHIAMRFNECFDADPLLPPDLLPRPWPGREAREVLVRCRRLGVLARADQSGPALFRFWDEIVEQHM